MRSEGYSTQFVCVCVLSHYQLRPPLTYGYKVRYESKASAVLKVFDSRISLKILRSKVTALFAHHNKLRWPVDTSEDSLMTTEDLFYSCIPLKILHS